MTTSCLHLGGAVLNFVSLGRVLTCTAKSFVMPLILVFNDTNDTTKLLFGFSPLNMMFVPKEYRIYLYILEMSKASKTTLKLNNDTN